MHTQIEQIGTIKRETSLILNFVEFLLVEFGTILSMSST